MNDKDICPKCGKNHREEMIKIIAKSLVNEFEKDTTPISEPDENNTSEMTDLERLELYRDFCYTTRESLRNIVSLSIMRDEEIYLAEMAMGTLRELDKLRNAVDWKITAFTTDFDSDDDEDDDDDDME